MKCAAGAYIKIGKKIIAAVHRIQRCKSCNVKTGEMVALAVNICKRNVGVKIKAR